MDTASAYKALCQEDKLFLLDTAQKVAMLVDKSQKRMDYFRKQLREFGEKWGAWKTAFDAERKGKWKPSMGKPDNPLETIWPSSAGAGCFPFCGGDIRPVLGGYALLAVINDNVLPRCPSIAKSILPTELGNKIWRDLITGANEEDRLIIPDATYSPRRVIPVLKIENFLRDVETDIEIHCAPKNSTKQIRRTREAEQKGDGKAENKRRVKTPASDDRADLAEVPISELIKKGESHTLEFKETLECDTRQNRKSKDVLLSSLKTTAGFLNAEGGTLLIGVDDSGEIKGIKRDKHGNNDKFEQKIRNYLRERFESQPFGKVNISFEKLKEKTICRVDVQASEDIIHLDNKVYVREGNTTQLLEGRTLTNWLQQSRKGRSRLRGRR